MGPRFIGSMMIQDQRSTSDRKEDRQQPEIDTSTCEIPPLPSLAVAASRMNRDIEASFLASYPGSGARLLSKLVETFTGFPTTDDVFSNGLRHTVGINTYYPCPEGQETPGAGSVQRAAILIRHPLDSIPAYHNLLYQQMNNLPIAPEEDWAIWSKTKLLQQLDTWTKHLEYWVDRYTPQQRLLVVSYEQLMSSKKGPQVAEALAEFLSLSNGVVVTIPTDDIPCVWQRLVNDYELTLPSYERRIRPKKAIKASKKISRTSSDLQEIDQQQHKELSSSRDSSSSSDRQNGGDREEEQQSYDDVSKKKRGSKRQNGGREGQEEEEGQAVSKSRISVRHGGNQEEDSRSDASRSTGRQEIRSKMDPNNNGGDPDEQSSSYDASKDNTSRGGAGGRHGGGAGNGADEEDYQQLQPQPGDNRLGDNAVVQSGVGLNQQGDGDYEGQTYQVSPELNSKGKPESNEESDSEAQPNELSTERRELARYGGQEQQAGDAQSYDTTNPGRSLVQNHIGSSLEQRSGTTNDARNRGLRGDNAAPYHDHNIAQRRLSSYDDDITNQRRKLENKKVFTLEGRKELLIQLSRLLEKYHRDEHIAGILVEYIDELERRYSTN